MSYWSIGVGVPIKNRSFKIGTYGEDQLAAAYTSGVTLSINSDQRNLFGTNDYIVIGPSNNASHIGKSETAKIATVLSNKINLIASLDYNYAVSDYISGIGNKVAAGWSPDNTYANGVRCEGFDHDGKEHNSAQKFRAVWSPSSGTTYEYRRLRQTIVANTFIPFTAYRIGFYYKFVLNILDPELFCVVNDGVSDFINGVLVANNNVSTYTLFTHVATTNSAFAFKVIGESAGLIDILIGADQVGAGDPVDGTVYIDQIFLEHAKGTDGAGAGVYTFTEYPEFGSIQWERIDSFRRVQLRNLATKIYDSSGTSGKQYLHKISAQFDNVSEDFYENLIELMNYQLDGNFLVLHQDSVPKITPTLYGIMSITGLKHNMFDLSRVSFTLTFEEVG
jgi:hypothetical protein